MHYVYISFTNKETGANNLGGQFDGNFFDFTSPHSPFKLYVQRGGLV